MICISHKENPYYLSAVSFINTLGNMICHVINTSYAGGDEPLCQTLESNEYLTHLTGGFDDGTGITGLVLRTNKRLLFLGHPDAISKTIYDSREWDLGT
jgi:hypothetical protein